MLDFVVFHIKLCEGQPYVLKCYLCSHIVVSPCLQKSTMVLPHFLVMVSIPVRIMLWMQDYIFLFWKHDEWTLIIMGYNLAMILEWHRPAEVTLYFCLCSINRQSDPQSTLELYIFTTIFLLCFVISFGMACLSCCHHNTCITFIHLFFSQAPTFFCIWNRWIEYINSQAR